MSRAERRESAERRRKQMQIEWLQEIQRQMDKGFRYKLAVNIVAGQVSEIICSDTSRKAEVMAAWNELFSELKRKFAEAAKQEQTA